MNNIKMKRFPTSPLVLPSTSSAIKCLLRWQISSSVKDVVSHFPKVHFFFTHYWKVVHNLLILYCGGISVVRKLPAVTSFLYWFFVWAHIRLQTGVNYVWNSTSSWHLEVLEVQDDSWHPWQSSLKGICSGFFSFGSVKKKSTSFFQVLLVLRAL